MADFGFTPNLVSTGNVSPFRFVKIDGAFQGAAATAIADLVVGVSDGSVNVFNGTYHAVSGDLITLQPTNTVQITCGGTISAGDFLMPKATSDGDAVVAAGATARSSYVALEAGAAGQIIRAWRFGFRGPAFT